MYGNEGEFCWVWFSGVGFRAVEGERELACSGWHLERRAGEPIMSGGMLDTADFCFRRPREWAMRLEGPRDATMTTRAGRKDRTA